MSDTTTAQNNEEHIKRMFAVGMHYGYSKARRHPSTSPYVFGVKDSIEIIDLTKVDALLERAKAFAHTLGSEGKTLLLVGGKHEARASVRNAAERTGLPFVCGRWIGGALTNFSEIKKRIDRLEDLRGRRERGDLAKYTKRERLMIDREIAKLEEKFGGLVGMTKVPDALLIVDPKFEHIAFAEATELQLPVIALANSDCNIAPIAYPIVGNDSARASIGFVVEEVVHAYEQGRKGAAAAKVTTPASAVVA